MRHFCLPLLALVACGTPPDPVDPGPDAGPMVTVEVGRIDFDNAGQRDIPVVFSNPDGSVASVVLSDVEGEAKAPLPEGGSVTMVWTQPVAEPGQPTILTTVMGVHSDDTIHLTMGGLIHNCTPWLPVDVTVTAFAGAASYKVFGRSEELDLGSSLSGTLQLASCADGDYVAVAYDAGGTAIATSEVTGQDTNNPTPVQFPPFAAVGAFHVHLTHADRAGATLEVARISTIPASATPATAPTIDLDFPAVNATWAMRMVTTVATADSVARVIDPIADADTSYSLDLDTDVPTGTLAVAYADRRVDITRSTSLEPTYLYVHFASAVAQNQDDWHILAAPDTTSLVIPQLPDDLASLDMAVDGRPTAWLVKSDSIGAWETSHVSAAQTNFRLLNGQYGTNRVSALYATAP